MAARTMSVGVRIVDLPQFRDFVAAAERVVVAALPYKDSDPQLHAALRDLEAASWALTPNARGEQADAPGGQER